MSLLIKAGITRLSELIIDGDKDWAGRGISNLREAAAGMNVGDILYHDGTRLVRLTPGPMGTQLLTKGHTLPPSWGYPDVG